MRIALYSNVIFVSESLLASGTATPSQFPCHARCLSPYLGDLPSRISASFSFLELDGALRYPIVERPVFWFVGSTMETTCVSCTLLFRRENHPLERFLIPVRAGFHAAASGWESKCRNMERTPPRILPMLNGIRCRILD